MGERANSVQSYSVVFRDWQSKTIEGMVNRDSPANATTEEQEDLRKDYTGIGAVRRMADC